MEAAMDPNEIRDRRQFLKRIAIGSAATLFSVRGAFAQELVRTPPQTEGPYYPIQLPLDQDNDLLIINDNITPAIGEIVQLSGRVLTPSGNPVRNARVEIWQADNTGAYLHSRSMGYSTRDVNFQGYGRFETASNGEYLFRTIKPGLYTGRTRHIHFKVKSAGRQDLTTQCYFEGEPRNDSDGVLRGIHSERERKSVIVAVIPIAGSKVAASAARFDIVLGS
jgi:protocatechuate 3,4-dioxygenase, beta subunit